MPDTALMQFLLYIALYESKCMLVGGSLATAGKGRNCMPKQIL